MMLAHIRLEKGCVVPMHAHENEQFSWVLEGALRFVVGGDDGHEIEVRSGEVLHLPSDVPHSAEALEDSVGVDIFSPPRSDWLDGSDDDLRGAGDAAGESGEVGADRARGGGP